MTAHSPSPEPWTYDDTTGFVYDASGEAVFDTLAPISYPDGTRDANGHRIVALSAENARLRLELDGFYTANGVVSDEDRKEAGWWGRACARLQSKATAAKEENARLREALTWIQDLLAFHEGTAKVQNPENVGECPTVYLNGDDLDEMLLKARTALRAGGAS